MIMSGFSCRAANWSSILSPPRIKAVLRPVNLPSSLVNFMVCRASSRVVFDEADRLFEMGFAEQLQEIIGRLPGGHQTVLFSATLPKLLVEFARAGLTEPVLIRLDVDSKLNEQLKTSFLLVREDTKAAVLLYLLQNVVRPQDQTVVFVSRRSALEPSRRPDSRFQGGHAMKILLLCVALLLIWDNGMVLGEQEVSDNELQELSTQGSRYINKEIQNAVQGVKHIKTLIEKTNAERKSLLNSLEEAKKKKEDALEDTRDSEMKLKAFPEVCNETMMALWEECKPCLKHTCMKFYARVCRSGSGLVGQQLEEFLNQSSPFYFWMNGDRIDSLLESDRQQSQVLDAMQDSFARASGIIDTLFQDRFFARELHDPHYFSPIGFPHKRPHFLYPKSRLVRSLMSPSHYGPPSFHNMFQPFFEMIHQAQQAMDVQLHSPAFQFPDVDFLREGEDDRTVCKEIRRNSTGCLKMKGQCEKCQEILSVDCSTNNPAQANLRQELNDSLQVAERLTEQYKELLQSFQSKMLNTSSLLEQLNDQFNWVSQLANLTQGEDKYYLRVSTVTTHSSDSEVPSRVTEVVVKLFDSDPITVVLPEEVSKDNPKFMDTVAEKALQEYRRKSRAE